MRLLPGVGGPSTPTSRLTRRVLNLVCDEAGSMRDQTAVLQAMLNAAPLGSKVVLPPQSGNRKFIKIGAIKIPAGIKLESDGAVLYGGTITFSAAVSQEYNCVLRDVWFKRCVFLIEGPTYTGTSTGTNTNTTLNDTNATWQPDQWKNYFVRITSGTGVGSGTAHLITGNTDKQLTIRSTSPFGTVPDATSGYSIVANISSIVFDNCYIDGSDVNDQGAMIGSTVGQTSMVSAVKIANLGFGVSFVNGTRIGNYQGWGIDIHGNSEDDLVTGAPYLATGVEIIGEGGLKIFNMGGRNAGQPVGSADSTSITRASGSWPVNYYAGWYVEITGGTGAGQIRLVKENSANKLTLHPGAPWEVTPSTDSTFHFFTGGGVRFLGGPKDGGTLKFNNYLLDHCQCAIWIDDAAGGIPTVTPTGSGGITAFFNNGRIELCGGVGGTIKTPSIYNARGNVFFNNTWYASDITTAGYKNCWHRSGAMDMGKGRFTTGSINTYALYCEPGYTVPWEVRMNNPNCVGAVRPVQTFESYGSEAFVTTFRLRITKTAGGLTVQNLATNGAGFGLGNTNGGDQWSTEASANIALGGSVSVPASGSTTYNRVTYAFNAGGDQLTVTLASRVIYNAVNAGLAFQTAGFAGLSVDIQALNGTANFTLLFKDASGTAVNVNSMATGKTIDVFATVTTQRS